jgi:hypothetical protein
MNISEYMETSARVLGEYETRASAIRHRRLEIAAELAEMKRIYVVNGENNCFARRVTLEAENAKIALELNNIKDLVLREKAERKTAIDKALLTQLLNILNSKGLNEIVDEAKSKVEAA